MSTNADPAERRKEALERYFWCPPPIPKAVSPFWIGLAIGLLLLVFLLSEVLGTLAGTLAGLLALPVLGFLTLALLEPDLANRLLHAVLESRGSPRDSEVDDWTSDSVTKSIDRSQTVLQIKEDEVLAYPITNTRALPPFGQPESPVRIRERIGKDGRSRSPWLQLRILWMTQSRIATFECSLDLISDRISREKSHEYSPAEISSVTLGAVDLESSNRRSGTQEEPVVLEVTFRNGERARVRLHPRSLEPGAVPESAVLLLLRTALLRSPVQSHRHTA